MAAEANDVNGKKRIFVWNVPFGCAENDLAECARIYGSVRHVFLSEKKPRGGKAGALHAGFGYVEFSNVVDATKFVDAAKTGQVTMGDGNQMRAIKADGAKVNKPRKRRSEETKTDMQVARLAELILKDTVEAIDWTDVAPKKAKPSNNEQSTAANQIEILPVNESKSNAQSEAEQPNEILQRLPAELWSRLLSYIDLPNLMRLKLVSRQMLRIVDVTIRNMLALDLSVPPDVQLCRSGTTFASKYIHVDQYLLSRIFAKSNDWSSLRRLKLNSDKVRITPKTVKILVQRLHSLEDLSICCDRVVNQPIKQLFVRNKKLRRLSFTARSGALSMPTLRALFKRCVSLTHLTLDFSKISFNFGENIDTANLESIRTLSEKLFAKKPQQLRFLNCKTKPEDSVKFELLLCTAFPTLTIAHLTAMPAVAMANLRQLVLPNLPVGVDASVWNLLPNLESFIVSSSNPVRHDNSELSFLASPNCRVTEIALRSCGIRDNDLMFIQRMKRVDLRDNCSLTDDGIKSFLNGNPNIERLGLRGLCEISGALLRFIATNFARLQLLNIADCPKIDNEAIQSIVSARSSTHPSNRSPVSMTVIAPGCHVDADQSFLKMLKAAGVYLFSSWGDISKMPVVSHFEPSVIDNVAEEEWPLSSRPCGVHRLNQNNHLIDFDDFDIEDLEEDDPDGIEDMEPSLDSDDPDEDWDDPDEFDELNG